MAVSILLFAWSFGSALVCQPAHAGAVAAAFLQPFHRGVLDQLSGGAPF